MNIDHFVLTRFNVRTAAYLKTQRWQGGDMEYLENRFRLFESYCLASMKRQTVAVRWLVFFSELTPACFRSRILSYSRECPSFEPVFVNDAVAKSQREYDALYEHAVWSRAGVDCDWCIMTRIDNDDAFNIEAIKWIRECAERIIAGKPEEKFFIVLPSGNSYIAHSCFAQRMKIVSNHFLSLVCKRSVGGNPFEISHSKITHSGTAIYRDGHEHAWLEVVHGGNQLNSFCPRYRVAFMSANAMERFFGVTENIRFVRTFMFWVLHYLPARGIWRLARIKRKLFPGKNGGLK